MGVFFMVQTLTRQFSSATALANAYDIFMLDRKVRRLTESSLDFYADQIPPFLAWCEAQSVTTLDAVRPAVLRGYLAHLQDRNLADHSIHAAARALRAWLNFCVNEELIAVSPMKKVSMPKLDKRILPAFTEHDVKQLLAAATNSRDKTIVLFLLDSGCRASEFLALDGGDIDAKTGTVRIRLGKGRKDRSAYLGNRTRRALLRYYLDRGGQPGEHDPVWTNERSGERLTDSGLRQLLERLGKRASVEHCHPHTFRRTFALWSLRNGMNLYHLQRLMGHADISVLRQYLALVDDDLKDAHAKYGAVDQSL